ncbi:hypothetical protein VARIO8X_60537 [Burkholderiales bacterium 8X]|nr:hypothetical protein VARIO8X_60537 [Burkholderiales bacterium 8X]
MLDRRRAEDEAGRQGQAHLSALDRLWHARRRRRDSAECDAEFRDRADLGRQALNPISPHHRTRRFSIILPRPSSSAAATCATNPSAAPACSSPSFALAP